MTTLTKPLRVVLWGRAARVAGPVAQMLQPEYEVIHFIQSVEQAKTELPLVLAGKDPRTPSSANDDDNDADANAAAAIGTHNYEVPPRAVVVGRGFAAPDVQEAFRACAGANQEPVAWVMGNPDDVPSGPPGPGYAEEVTRAVKHALGAWTAQGGKKDGIIMY